MTSTSCAVTTGSVASGHGGATSVPWIAPRARHRAAIVFTGRQPPGSPSWRSGKQPSREAAACRRCVRESCASRRPPSTRRPPPPARTQTPPLGGPARQPLPQPRQPVRPDTRRADGRVFSSAATSRSTRRAKYGLTGFGLRRAFQQTPQRVFALPVLRCALVFAVRHHGLYVFNARFVRKLRFFRETSAGRSSSRSSRPPLTLGRMSLTVASPTDPGAPGRMRAPRRWESLPPAAPFVTGTVGRFFFTHHHEQRTDRRPRLFRTRKGHQAGNPHRGRFQRAVASVQEGRRPRRATCASTSTRSRAKSAPWPASSRRKGRRTSTARSSWPTPARSSPRRRSATAWMSRSPRRTSGASARRPPSRPCSSASARRKRR